MGPLSTILTLPVGGPLSGLGWLARQIAKAATDQLLDPKRIEAALLALERRLEDGQVDEATFEAEEALLLRELAEMAELRAATARASGDEDADDGEDAEPEVDPTKPASGGIGAPPSPSRPSATPLQSAAPTAPSSWPGLSGPPPQGTASADGPDKPGHDGIPAPAGTMQEANAWISA